MFMWRDIRLGTTGSQSVNMTQGIMGEIRALAGAGRDLTLKAINQQCKYRPCKVQAVRFLDMYYVASLNLPRGIDFHDNSHKTSEFVFADAG